MFNIKLYFNDTKEIKKVNDKHEYIIQEEDYDGTLSAICTIFHESNRVIFKVSGFGSDDWGMDCKCDLPCVLEQMDEIVRGIKSKEEFSIDFYEQGRECLLIFQFCETQVLIEYNNIYSKNIDNSILYMDYEVVKQMFFDFYNDFIYCIKKLVPEVMENQLFNEWKAMCKW
ncbi:hypothetical protein UT300005_17040 [Clostridium sp. CTA-5]